MNERARKRALVERVLWAARLIADPSHELGRRARGLLLKTSGLSAEGIELALSEYLETNPSGEELEALLDRAHAPSSEQRANCVYVVMAANVCTAALRAIAFALVRSPCVRVKPSRRDPVVAELLVEALSGDEVFGQDLGGSIACVNAVEASPGDEIHVYGRDATVEALRQSAGARVRLLGFGNGYGIALIGLSADAHAAARGLARDMVVFDQRGCLSPRVLFIEGGELRAVDVCEALHRALLVEMESLPRGEVDPGAQSELSLYQASLEAVGRLWIGPEHRIGLDESSCPRALLLPPPVRAIHAVSVNASTFSPLLESIQKDVTVIGSDDGEGDFAKIAFERCPSARRARLGQMQKPPLDGPVDRRL